jgi:membrane protein implicated in regulation of membrane protease activity
MIGRRSLLLAIFLLLLVNGPASAYVGPGAGLTLLGTLWGVLIAVLAALSFLVLWPLRRFVRQRRHRGRGRE